MSDKWQKSEELVRLFQAIGRASLIYDIQDSHSGNMAMKVKDQRGKDRMVITATGSQKGDLEPEHICIPAIDQADFGYYKASSESDIHARILALPGVFASMHAHTKELTIATLEDTEIPRQPKSFIPVDPLGWYHLNGEIPVDWFAVPSGSIEMTEGVPARLARHPVTAIQGHGAFARGRTLKEAFFLLCIANNSGYIVNLCQRLKIDVEALREQIKRDPDAHFAYPLPEFNPAGDQLCDFADDEEMVKEFKKAGNRIFESRLSPFFTGSMSLRGVRTMFYAPKASMPRDLSGPLLEVPLACPGSNDDELNIHRAIYAESNFQTVMHCYVPEAEACSYFVYPGEDEPNERIIPVDAEGSFLYLVIPILPPKFDLDKLIQLLHDYKMVIIRGGGVWAVGTQSISEVLHHPSSLREICLYRIGAFERGLDLRKMEPKKAKKW
jgi:ribulose-5-phosphate 4-epimerase/fuculose-1-phosphate aldolase